jgi:hypothetical protein
MNARLLILSLALTLAPGPVLADDKKADEKKAAKAKSSSGKKEKNVFQKAESDIGNWADRNNVWNRKSATAKKN